MYDTDRVQLGDLLDYEQPTRYIVSSTDYDDAYDTPVLTAGQTFILGYTNETEGIYKASKSNPVIIFDDFVTSFYLVDFDFKVKSSALKILKPKKDVNIYYVYYAMLGISFVPKEHARHWISKYSQFEIAYPSLAKQQEIVSQLDTFTTLISNLESELDMRRKQYEHYRNQLLDFEGVEGVEWKTLGDICDLKNGYTPSTKNPDFWDNGHLPWFTLEDIRKNGNILYDAIKHITPLGIKRNGLFPKDSIIVSTTATIGEYALVCVDFMCNQQITCISISEACKNLVLVKYLYHLGYKIGDWCRNNVNGGGGLSIVSTSKLKQYSFPIPSLAKQQEIVEKLDAFEQLIQSFEQEIKLRKQQYEYYREKLLTFEKE